MQQQSASPSVGQQDGSIPSEAGPHKAPQPRRRPPRAADLASEHSSPPAIPYSAPTGDTSTPTLRRSSRWCGVTRARPAHIGSANRPAAPARPGPRLPDKRRNARQKGPPRLASHDDTALPQPTHRTPRTALTQPQHRLDSRAADPRQSPRDPLQCRRFGPRSAGQQTAASWRTRLCAVLRLCASRRPAPPATAVRAARRRSAEQSTASDWPECPNCTQPRSQRSARCESRADQVARPATQPCHRRSRCLSRPLQSREGSAGAAPRCNPAASVARAGSGSLL